MPVQLSFPQGEDGCGGATFGIGNLQFIRNLYKITYNLELNYKLQGLVKTRKSGKSVKY